MIKKLFNKLFGAKDKSKEEEVKAIKSKIEICEKLKAVTDIKIFELEEKMRKLDDNIEETQEECRIRTQKAMQVSAKRLFPDLSDEEALDKLYKTIRSKDGEN